MKFSVAAVVALAAGAQASYKADNVTYTTEVVTAYTTYCPAATQLTYGGKTYTVTEATTLTISDCPCTVSKPVYTTSSVVCSTCTSTAPAVYPTTYANTTVATSTSVKATGGYTTTKASTTASAVPTAGAGKVAALSGAALAGVVGLAAFL